jgi:hypothetical protein
MDYETRRKQKIIKNEQLLASLGLENVTPTLTEASKSNIGQKKRTLKRVASRKSSRLLRQEAPIVELPDSDSDAEMPIVRVQKYSPSVNNNPKSTKNTVCNLDVYSNYLAKQITPIGGQMKGACIHLGSPSKPSFNKYSGIVEWKNCVFLFVNIDSNNYKNQFKEGVMTWFGQPSQTFDSPVIQRMLNPQTPILLFLRNVAEPYFYFGRVESVESTDSTPIQLTLRLVDWLACQQVFPPPSNK